MLSSRDISLLSFPVTRAKSACEYLFPSRISQRVRKFKRVQVRSRPVFDDLLNEYFFGFRRLNPNRHRLQASPLGSLIPTLARKDQVDVVVFDVTDGNRLKHAVRSNRRSEFLQVRGIDTFSWLVGIWLN